MKIARVWGEAANGDVVEVVVSRQLIGELMERWPPLGLVRRQRPNGQLAAHFGLSNDALVVPQGDNLGACPLPAAWDHLESELTLFAAQRLTDVLAVHAAVVEQNGVVLVVPGSSGAGKSTLSVAASEAGARVLSDEYALIDPANGLVTGWPRAVRILHGDRVERIDLAVASPPLPVGLLAIVAHRPGGVCEWNAISAAEATVQILAHTICAKTRPDASLDAALAVARQAPAVAGVRGEASEAIGQLLDLMEGGHSVRQ